MTATAMPLPPGAVTVPARIEYTGREAETATADLLRRTPRDRATRAALGWAACWGLAAAAVFVPLLHFLLVPALLLAGLLVARARWREKATVLRVRGRCPGCGVLQDHAVGQAAKETMSFRCDDCGRPLALRLDPALIESDAPATPTALEDSR